MANALYDKGRESFLGSTTGSINWQTDTIKACLVSSSYSPSLATHQFLTSVTAHTGSLTAQTLSNKDSTNGIANADDISFTAVSAGLVWPYVLIFKDTGNIGTSMLIALIDTANGLPVTSSGGDIGVTWDNGTNKIFKL